MPRHRGGSSARRAGAACGCCARARASSTRCRSPPDKVEKSRCSSCAAPAVSSAAATIWSVSRADAHIEVCGCRPSATTSDTGMAHRGVGILFDDRHGAGALAPVHRRAGRGRRSSTVPAVGCLHARERAQQRRLPGAVRPDERRERARGHVDRDIVEDDGCSPVVHRDPGRAQPSQPSIRHQATPRFLARITREHRRADDRRHDADRQLPRLEQGSGDRVRPDQERRRRPAR